MKPVARGDKEHLVKVGEEIDQARNETPISIISTREKTETLPMPTIVQERSKSVKWTGHHVLSVLTTICCFGPCSVIGLVQFLTAKSDYNNGNTREGLKRKRQAKLWSWLALTIGVVLVVAFITYLRLCANNYASSDAKESKELQRKLTQLIDDRVDENMAQQKARAKKLQENENGKDDKEEVNRNSSSPQEKKGEHRGTNRYSSTNQYQTRSTPAWLDITSSPYLRRRFGYNAPRHLYFYLFSLPSFSDYPVTETTADWQATTPSKFTSKFQRWSSTWEPTQTEVRDGQTWNQEIMITPTTDFGEISDPTGVTSTTVGPTSEPVTEFPWEVSDFSASWKEAGEWTKTTDSSNYWTNDQTTLPRDGPSGTSSARSILSSISTSLSSSTSTSSQAPDSPTATLTSISTFSATSGSSPSEATSVAYQHPLLKTAITDAAGIFETTNSPDFEDEQLAELPPRRKENILVNTTIATTAEQQMPEKPGKKKPSPPSSNDITIEVLPQENKGGSN